MAAGCQLAAHGHRDADGGGGPESPGKPEVQLAAFGGGLSNRPDRIAGDHAGHLCPAERFAPQLPLPAKLLRVMGISLTALRNLVAFTPLFDLLVVPILDPPEGQSRPDSDSSACCPSPGPWRNDDSTRAS